MKISVSGFKAIQSLERFDICRLNILTGVNSGGKSSILQLLLLLKQSLERNSDEVPLKLNKPYVSLGRFDSIVFCGQQNKSIAVTFHLDQKDLGFRYRTIVSAFTRMKKIQGETVLDGVDVKVTFKERAGQIIVDEYELTLLGPIQEWLKMSKTKTGHKYRLTSSSIELFITGSFQVAADGAGPIEFKESVLFLSFLPFALDSEHNDLQLFVRQIRTAISSFFAGISYIGPLREEPKEYYFQDDDDVASIGNKGENAAFILAAEGSAEIRSLWFDPVAGKLQSSQKKSTLKHAVEHWLCQVFGLANDLAIDQSRPSTHIHEISLGSRLGARVPIIHVGFGISQILPILVEGLRPKRRGNSLVILEQPEIHLHPKVQSLLFDFIWAVSDQKSFIVETHSDHFINRLRRRVAESETDELVTATNLTFANDTEGGTDYQRIFLNSRGSIDQWPKGFFDQFDDEFRMIVRAQSKKSTQAT